MIMSKMHWWNSAEFCMSRDYSSCCLTKWATYLQAPAYQRFPEAQSYEVGQDVFVAIRDSHRTGIMDMWADGFDVPTMAQCVLPLSEMDEVWTSIGNPYVFRSSPTYVVLPVPQRTLPQSYKSCFGQDVWSHPTSLRDTNL